MGESIMDERNLRLPTPFGGHGTAWRLCVAACGFAVSGWAHSGSAPTALLGPLDRAALVLSQTERVALLGVAHAGARTVAVGERGSVLLSDDLGAHWRQAASVPVSATLTAVQFVNERTGWAIGHSGVVLRSDDGGEHWVKQMDGRAAAALMLEEAQANDNPKALTEARRAVQEGADKPLLALRFQNEREGWAVGAFNLALRTHDGGKTWQSFSARLPNPGAAHLYGLDQEGDDILIAGEQGLLMHSGDGGQHFDAVTTPYEGSFFGVARESGGTWLVAGLRGNVLRSTDQGKTWDTLTGQPPVSVTSVMRDARGMVWLANQAGQIMQPQRTSNALRMVATTKAQQPAGLLRLSDGSLLIAGWNGITRLTLDGASTAR